MAYTAGTAFLKVVPSFAGFHSAVRTEIARMDISLPVRLDVSRLSAAEIRARIGTIDVTVTMDSAHAVAELSALRAQMAALRNDMDSLRKTRVKVDVDKRPFLDAANAVAMFAGNLRAMAVPVIAGLAVPAALELTSAIAASSQALLLLPAVGAVVGLAFGTIALGANGIGKAFKDMGDPKKFAEDLAKLSPAAQSFALAAQSVRPAFMDMQLGVQDALMRGLSGTVRELGATYLPVLKTGFSGIASELNLGAVSIGKFFTSAQSVRDVQTIFANTRATMAELVPTGTAIMQIFRDIAVVGSEFLPGLAYGFQMAVFSARDFISEARGTGDIKRWIQEGINTIQLFSQIFLAAGNIIAGVMRAADLDSRGFMITLRDGIETASRWVNSFKGQEYIGVFFRDLRAVVAALLPVVGAVVVAIAMMVGSILPALPPLIKGLGDVFNASGSMLGVFKELTLIILPLVGSTLSALAPILGPIVIAWTMAATATKLYAVGLAAVKMAQLVGSAAMAAYLLVMSGFNVGLAAGTANTLGLAGAQSILTAIMNLNPFVLIAVAVVAFAAALIYAYNHCETFRNIVNGAWTWIKQTTETVFNAVKAAIAAAWSFIQGVFFAMQTGVEAVGAGWTWLYENAIRPAWEGIQTGLRVLGEAFTWLWQSIIVPAFDGIVFAAKLLLAIVLTAVLTPIYLFVTKVLAPIWDWLYSNVVRPAFQGIQDFLGFVWNWLQTNVFNPIVSFITGPLTDTWNNFATANRIIWQAIQDVLSRIWNWIKDNIWQPIINFIDGPMTTTWNAFATANRIIWEAIQNVLLTVWNWIRNNIWQPIINFLDGPMTTGFRVFGAAVAMVWEGIQNVLSVVWNWIRNNIWDPLMHFVTVLIPDAFRTGADAVGRAWNAIKKIVRDPIEAVVDFVYNQGIVKVWNWVVDIVGGLPKLGEWHVPMFAKGGPVTKPTMGIMGEAGPEYVMSAPAVRNAGGIGAVDTMHQDLLRGNTREREGKTLRALRTGKLIEGADHDGGGYSRSGFGGVQPWVAQAGWFLKQKFGINSVGGVGARPGASDHPGGLALDFMTAGENGTALANYLASAANWNHFATKYVIWRQRIMESPGSWSGMPNRGSPTANHMDHVHVSFTGTPGKGASGGGGGFTFDPLGFITNAIGFDPRAMLQKLTGGSPWAQAAIGMGSKMVNGVWDSVVGKVSGWWNSIFTGETPINDAIGSINVRNAVQAVANAYGWGNGPEWTALVKLVQKESSWNPNAQNKTSTAYGLFQFLNSTWATVGATKTSDPAGQGRAGLRYIQSKYGTPARALAFHNANNWYDRGGRLQGQGLFYKNTLSPERVLSDRQNRHFERLVGTLDRVYTGRAINDRDDRAFVEAARRGPGSGGGNAPLVGTLIAQVPAGSSAAEVVDAALFKLRHTRRGIHDR